MKTPFRMLSAAVLCCGMLSTANLIAQPAQQPAAMSPSGADKAPAQTWPINDLLPLTVHEAWMKSNKDEGVFFQIVTQLAEFSAERRGLVLPETAAAGRRAGNMIKAQAKVDTDQLLYAVVDKAVKTVGKPGKAATGE